MAYDAAQGNEVMFGGTDYQSSFTDDTWAWETEVTATPPSLVFRNLGIAGGTLTKKVILNNPGPSKVVIDTASITPTGGDPAAFSVHEYFQPRTLKAGKRCVIAVTFQPHSAGLNTATLNIPFNGPGSSPLAVPLSGTGINKK